MVPAEGTASRSKRRPVPIDRLPWVGLFDLFRIGIGPSSSHTIGTMLASRRFAREIPVNLPARRSKVELFGSLALTGNGHATDTAVALGLMGEHARDVDPTGSPS